ncbi:MAG TPA: ribonuclease HI family protein [Candidatus Portnoybacteria bacterium]|nr:ribonuclease HI family protein [Candidatus Portnoybacteria bacterium]
MINSNTWQIYTDGGARGNPGPAAAGIIIYSPNKEILKKGVYLGKTTNNSAEYQAVILALEKLKKIIGSKESKEAEIEIRSDSELLVKQLNHQYKVKNENIVPYFIRLWNLTTDFKKIKFIHIPREKNKLADQMVNQTLDEKLSKISFNI